MFKIRMFLESVWEIRREDLKEFVRNKILKQQKMLFKNQKI